MNEFYKNYTKKLLQKILEAYRNGDKKTVENYTLELKELNKTMFLDNQMAR